MTGPEAVPPLLVGGLLLAAGLLRPARPVAGPPGAVRVRRRDRRAPRGRGRRRAPGAAPGLAGAAGAEQVAALLRAGVAPLTAWEVLDAAPRPGASGEGDGLRVVHVVRRLVSTTGAPAAEALEACAAGLRADAAARAAVRTALAGARVSARTVSALPLLGLGLGALLGARPWEVLVSSGPGRACVVAGVVLLLAGHRWSSHLVRRAETAGR